MTLEICEKTRIAYYWLTREEDETTKELLKPQFKDWKNKGYKVCVFISGTGNLVDLTKELLIHNKELAARKCMWHQVVTAAINRFLYNKVSTILSQSL